MQRLASHLADDRAGLDRERTAGSGIDPTRLGIGDGVSRTGINDAVGEPCRRSRVDANRPQDRALDLDLHVGPLDLETRRAWLLRRAVGGERAARHDRRVHDAKTP